jgi:hypothetical protein
MIRSRSLSILTASYALAFVFPTIAGAHHQDPNIDSDGDGVTNYNDTCPYVPDPNCTFRDAGGTVIDSDGDGYNINQDPCDNNASNAECDTDGDGEPNQYDPCPTVPSGHLLGSDKPLDRQDRNCPPPEARDGAVQPGPDALPSQESLATSLGVPEPARAFVNLTEVTLVPGQTRHTVLKSGLKLHIACNRTCVAHGGVALRNETLASVLRTKRTDRHHKTLILKLSKAAKRRAKRSRNVRGDVSVQAELGDLGLSDVVAGDLTIGPTRARQGLAASNQASGSDPVRIRWRSRARAADSTHQLLNFWFYATPRQQLYYANVWQGMANQRNPGCILHIVGLPVPVNFGPADVGEFLAGYRTCDIAKEMSRVALDLTPTPPARSQWYSLQFFYTDRHWARDVCTIWALANGRWHRWEHGPSPGRHCVP